MLVTNVNHHDDYNERLLHSDSMLQRLEKTVAPVWASEQPLLSVTQVSHCVGVWLCARVLVGGWGAQAWEHLGQDPLADVLLLVSFPAQPYAAGSAEEGVCFSPLRRSSTEITEDPPPCHLSSPCCDCRWHQKLLWKPGQSPTTRCGGSPGFAT